ncbi:MAG: hypothetical protein COC23_04050 [Hyphomicrobiales bacterium]|nr:MAG: hypothetical protein COC23_04050 [Hyphomicrobiales bacterium]
MGRLGQLCWSIFGAGKRLRILPLAIKGLGGVATVIVNQDTKLVSLLQADDLDDCIARLCEHFELDHIILYLYLMEKTSLKNPFLKTNYPEKWVGRYLLQGYARVDPVAIAGFQKETNSLWSDLDWSSPKVRKYQTDAEAHGIGQSGLLVSQSDAQQRYSIINFSNNLNPADWAVRMEEVRPELVTCARLLHEKAAQKIFQHRKNIPQLTPRELECLRFAAGGKEAAAVAKELTLSEHTVRDYLKSARWKFGASNIAQAVHRATVLRLI